MENIIWYDNWYVLGYVIFDGIHEDRYTLYAQAEGHSSYAAVIIASPDSDTQEVFLQRIAVKYTWTVTPTTVQDTYIISVESTFETNVSGLCLFIFTL